MTILLMVWAFFGAYVCITYIQAIPRGLQLQASNLGIVFERRPQIDVYLTIGQWVVIGLLGVCVAISAYLLANVKRFAWVPLVVGGGLAVLTVFATVSGCLAVTPGLMFGGATPAPTASATPTPAPSTPVSTPGEDAAATPTP